MFLKVAVIMGVSMGLRVLVMRVVSQWFDGVCMFDHYFSHEFWDLLIYTKSILWELTNQFKNLYAKLQFQLAFRFKIFSFL